MPKNLVTLLTLTLITISVFVLVILAQVAFRSTIPEATQDQLTPLDPNLNESLIEELETSSKK